ncbi:hypothetical protein diail_3723 [Diaporthe ilicicola]|nr:hypothetical protein diail_3723 [Diaporthe ilicicola]
MDQDHTFEPLQAEPRRPRVSTGDPEPDALLRRIPSGHTSAQDVTSQAEPDTCRICRGEATPDEPLFYPCKCSGSIKFVHQDCLMEWLSHSQKKHCELCKTPFRFTKLYAPNMPKTVPFYVFISHITKYLFRNMLVWARGGLVLMVWLVWLPYLMRRVWSALFWLSDEGLGPVFGRPEASSVLGESAGSTAGAATCPSSPLHAATTTAASLQGLLSQIPRSSTAMTTTSLYGINITSDNPLSNILINMFLGTFYIGGTTSRSNASANAQSIAPATVVQQPTLLSEVRFLQKISSSSPALGSFAIDILEGQIITVLVIICFILIILVRDYVVQQQPDINMRAAFAAAENAAPQENVVPHAAMQEPVGALRAEDIDRLRGPEAEDVEFGGPLNGNEGHGERHWVDLGESAAFDGQPLAEEAIGSSDGPSGEASLQNTRVPTTPGTLANGREGHSTEAGRSTVDEYVRIHRAAAGDPETIINIIRQENLEDRLAYFVQLTQSQMTRKRPELHTEEGESSSQMAEWGSEPDWPWPDDAQGEEHHTGKGKTPLTNGSSDPIIEQSYTSRPRSATDGPQRVGGINPLGNNNWSWPDASPESPRADPRQSPTLGMPPSSQRTNPDEAGSASQPWAFATPPSSTLAESAPSSSQGQTPGSSEIDDVLVNELNADHGDVLDDAMETNRPLDWEAASDFNMPLEVQPNENAEDIGELAQDQPQADGLAQRLADFMWRDVEAIPAHELPPLPDAADEFFDHDQDGAAAIAQDPLPELQDQEQDQEVAAAAAAAGIDAEAEAIEDAEDLEGILELLGMRGPIAGLFQNALFCAFLVSITLFLGVFLPYNLGRLAIWLVANPARPVRILFSLSKLVQDTALLLMGCASTLCFGAMDTLFTLIQPNATRPEVLTQSMSGSWNMTENAFQRLVDSMWTDLPFISADEVRNFSTVSHLALFTLKDQVALLFATLGKLVVFLFGGDYTTKAGVICSWITVAAATVWQGLHDLPDLLLNPSSWVIDLGASASAIPLKAELASWSAMDRVWAILGGYVSLTFSAALYLGRGGPISPGRVGQEWEATLIDALNQASGVMKVILIIGIEMLVFPLYCGLLLDIGLLPLFENTTIMSRVMFTVNYPLTSIFVHWFVGTGYMFHFALFVSMCRKIMRKGVLCKLMPSLQFPSLRINTHIKQILFAIQTTPNSTPSGMFWSETSRRSCARSCSLLSYTAL